MSDRDIRASIEAGQIGLEPLDMSLLQPSSFDVRIDRFFRLFDNHKYAYIDPAEPQEELTRFIEVAPDEPFILHPGEFVLGSTYEFVKLPDNIAARLEGKSSLGRLGLVTHSTAGFVDPGFNGHVTLELSNMATLPIKLWPGMKIGQLCFFRDTVRFCKVFEPLPGSARANCLSLIHELSPHRRGQRAARAVSLKRKMPTSDGGHFCFELLLF
jgi:dCTP deaminase